MGKNGIEEVIKNFEDEVEKNEELAKSEDETKEETKEEESEKAKDSEEETEEEKEESEKAKDSEEETEEEKEKKKKKEKEESEKAKDSEEEEEEGEKTDKSNETPSDIVDNTFNEKISESLGLVVKSYQANSEQVESLRKSIDDLVERLDKSESKFEELNKSIKETKEEAIEKSIEPEVIEESPTSKSVTYAAKNTLDDSTGESVEKSEQEEEKLVFNEREVTRRLVEKSKAGKISRAKQDVVKKSIFNIMEGNFTDSDVDNINELMK